MLFISPKMLFCFFKFLNFSFLPEALLFQEKVENEPIMTSWNGLHKLPNVISGKTPKPLSVFKLRRQIWLGYGPQNKKASELVLSPFSFLKKTP